MSFEGADADARRAALSRGIGSTGISSTYGGGSASEISNSRPISQVSHPEPGSLYAGGSALAKVVGGSIVGNQAHPLEWQLAARQRESLLQTHQQTMHEQQVAVAGPSSSAGKRSQLPNQGGISFAAILPVLMSGLPPESKQKLGALFQKWKKGELPKEDLVRCLKMLAGDQTLLQAVRLVQHKQQQQQQQQQQPQQLTSQQQVFRAALPSYEQMIQKQHQQEQDNQSQHQQQKSQAELLLSEVKQTQEKQSAFHSQDTEEETDTSSSDESDLQSDQITTYTQHQTPQLDLKQQTHSLPPLGKFPDILSRGNMGLAKVKSGEQLLERLPLHLNPIPASLQQVKHEVDRSLASMQLTFQHQLSAHDSQGPSGAFHAQNPVAGKLSSQPESQTFLHEQTAEAQGNPFLQQSQLLQTHVVESVSVSEKPLSKYEKQKLRREQKKHEDEERLRKIQEADRLKKALNASNQQGAEQHLQHQQSQYQVVQQEPKVKVSNSERPNASTTLATLSVKQESYEQKLGHVPTLQSFQSFSSGRDSLELKASEAADAQPQLEVKQAASNLSRAAAANVLAVPNSMSLQGTAVSGGGSVSTVMPVSDGSMGQLDPQASMPGSLIQQIHAFQAQASLKKAVVIHKKPAEAAPVGQPPSKKMKVDGGDADQSIEQLNDVTVVSGVNLREEEEQLLVGPTEESRSTETTRRYALEEEKHLFLEKASLQTKVSSIATKHGIRTVGDDVERCLSMSVEERLWSMVHKLVKISQQQCDMEQEKHMIVQTSDVKTRVLLIKSRAKEELDRKKAEEAERLRQSNEEKQALADVGKDLTVKTQKEHQQEEDKQRTAANLVARAAVGVDDMLTKWQMMAEQGRQKRHGDSGTADSTAKTQFQDRSVGSEMKGSPLSHGRAATNMQETVPALSNGKPSDPASDASKSRSKTSPRITIKDVIAFLELEPQMNKSAFLYKLYERDRKPASDEEGSSKCL